ncbi:MAG: LLM class F420-dependent oxidoreductase [Acidimicrobiales bacterium]
MDVGVYTFATDLDMEPQRFATEAEDREFCALMLPEHSHIPVGRTTPYPLAYGGGVLPDFYKRTYDPFVALSFMAAATSRIRLGTGICLLALRDPIHTAKMVASVDALSGGRFVFGVGFGWNADEFLNHSESFEKRHSVVREKVELMKELWTKDVASYEGVHVRLDPSWCWPKPVQAPHPPVYLGGNGPVTMRQAACWADGWYPTGPLGDPFLDRSIPEFRQMASDAGRDPASLRIGIAPASVDEEALLALEANGVDECNVAVMGTDDTHLLANLDALARCRDRAFG